MKSSRHATGSSTFETATTQDVEDRIKIENDEDTATLKTAAFKICGSQMVRMEPLAAAVHFMNLHYENWEDFKTSICFPKYWTPVAKRKRVNSELMNTISYDETECKAQYALLKAFTDSPRRPIFIRSLKGKIFNENTPDNFCIFKSAIAAACQADECNYLYFQSPKTSKVPTDIVTHTEIGDLILLGNAGIVVVEIKSNNGSSKKGQKKAIKHLAAAIETHAISQLERDKMWILNAWKVPAYALSSKDSNYIPELSPPIHKIIALPNCPRENWERAEIDVPHNSNVAVLCKEDFEDPVSLQQLLHALLFEGNSSIGETYRHFIAMLCASKAFRTFSMATGDMRLDCPSGEGQIVANRLFRQDCIEGHGSPRAVFITNQGTQPVTVYQTDEQLHFSQMKRVDIRGAPGTGKTLLIQLKILERFAAPASKGENKLPILLLLMSEHVGNLYEIFLNANGIPYTIVPVNDDDVAVKRVKLATSADLKKLDRYSDRRLVVIGILSNPPAIAGCKKRTLHCNYSRFDSVFVDDVDAIDLLNCTDFMHIVKRTEIVWASFTWNSNGWKDEFCRSDDNKASRELGLSKCSLRKVMRYTLNHYHFMKRHQRIGPLFEGTKCGHLVHELNGSREYEVQESEAVDFVIELVKNIKSRSVGIQDNENKLHWERLALLFTINDSELMEPIETRLKRMGCPVGSKFGETGKLFIAKGTYSIEWPFVICIVEDDDDTPPNVSTTRAITEMHLVWVKTDD